MLRLKFRSKQASSESFPSHSSQEHASEQPTPSDAASVTRHTSKTGQCSEALRMHGQNAVSASAPNIDHTNCGSSVSESTPGTGQNVTDPQLSTDIPTTGIEKPSNGGDFNHEDWHPPRLHHHLGTTASSKPVSIPSKAASISAGDGTRPQTAAKQNILRFKTRRQATPAGPVPSENIDTNAHQPLDPSQRLATNGSAVSEQIGNDSKKTANQEQIDSSSQQQRQQQQQQQHPSQASAELQSNPSQKPERKPLVLSFQRKNTATTTPVVPSNTQCQHQSDITKTASSTSMQAQGQGQPSAQPYGAPPSNTVDTTPQQTSEENITSTRKPPQLTINTESDKPRKLRKRPRRTADIQATAPPVVKKPRAKVVIDDGDSDSDRGEADDDSFGVSDVDFDSNTTENLVDPQQQPWNSGIYSFYSLFDQSLWGTELTNISTAHRQQQKTTRKVRSKSKYDMDEDEDDMVYCGKYGLSFS